MCLGFVMLALSPMICAVVDNSSVFDCPRGDRMLGTCHLQSPDPLAELSASI